MADIRELFTFYEVATGNSYYLTSGQKHVDYGGDFYEARALKRGQFQDTDKMQKQDLKLLINLDNPLIVRWLRNSVDTVIQLTLAEYNADTGAYSIRWIGRLTTMNPKSADCELVFESVYTSMRRLGAAPKMNITCRHTLFGSRCGLDRETFGVVADVTDVTELVVTATQAAAQPDGYYAGGSLKDAAGFQRRINAHTGSLLSLSRPLLSLVDEIEQNGYTGLQVTLYPGCPKNSATCDSRFNNLLNFGGFEYMPYTNPFEGSIVKEVT